MIHPFEVANGRTGRVLWELLHDSESIDFRLLAGFVKSCPFAIEGNAETFMNKVAHAMQAIHTLGQYGVFAELFGFREARKIIGIEAPGIDEMPMSHAASFARRGDLNPNLAEHFALQIAAARGVFSPLKLVLVEQLRRSAPYFQSLITHRKIDSAFDVLVINGAPQLLRNINADEVAAFVSRSWDLADRLVEHLIDCYVHPDGYPPIKTGPKRPPIKIKDYFKINIY